MFLLVIRLSVALRYGTERTQLRLAKTILGETLPSPLWFRGRALYATKLQLTLSVWEQTFHITFPDAKTTSLPRNFRIREWLSRRRVNNAKEAVMAATNSTSKRGFASMDGQRQREIASKGGRSVPAEKRSFSQDRELASEAGRKGGQASGGTRSAQE
jgi:general stress protein YciG